MTRALPGGLAGAGAFNRGGLQAGLNRPAQQMNDLPVQAARLAISPFFEEGMQIVRYPDEGADQLRHDISVRHLATTSLLCYYHTTTKVAR